MLFLRRHVRRSSSHRMAMAITRSEIMSRVRSSNTGPEIAFASYARAMGIRATRLLRGLPGRPDFTIMDGRLAIHVDGCFWHGCRRHYRAPKTNAKFWREKVAMNMARDRRVNAATRRMGWRVARIRECDLLERPELTMLRLEALIS